MRRFFFFGSPAANPGGEGNEQPISDNKTSRHKKTDEGKDSSGSCSTRLSRSRSRRQKRSKEEPADPKQLRRSMSFSSPARNSCVDERCLASRVMFHALCMMNLMHPTMPKMSCKWSCYLIITVRTTYNTRCLPLIEMIVEYWLLAPVAYLPFDPC